MKRKRVAKPTGRRNLSVAATVAGMLPLLLSAVVPAALEKKSPTAKPISGAAAKTFNIPVSSLQEWSSAVIVTIDDVVIGGNSNVHPVASDCEMHFGATSSGFTGDPPGIVLEPMNICIVPFPGKAQFSKADWLDFANRVKDQTVTASGVPRIWPEHLKGGNEPSNPNHAVEIHPLTSLVAPSETVNFAPDVFAGDFKGGLGGPTALNIVQNTTVSVASDGDSAEISFKSGTIGNFTVMDLVIDKDTIVDDGHGSLRMDGTVETDNGSVSVTVVTTNGSPINNEMQKNKGKHGTMDIHGLVLFSLSPQALLDAAQQSDGTPVEVVRPIQLILYGPPNEK